MNQLLTPPFDAQTILLKQKRLKREIRASQTFMPLRVALLGGATTSLVKDFLELFLLDAGYDASFYESAYGSWYEEAVFPNEQLEAFDPQVILFHTGLNNLREAALPSDTREQAEERAHRELARYEQAWQALEEKYHPIIVQDNFCLPGERVLGNLAGVLPGGAVRYVRSLNERMSEMAAAHSSVLLHDVCYLSAQVGLEKWFDEDAYRLYKTAVSLQALPVYCHSVAGLIRAAFGKSAKCLVLDLDNTLWGGVIGEDGLGGICLGRENALAEAYLAFQQYVLRLRQRGILLAVCSKNDEEQAKEGFSHPDSALKLEDFAAFCANWDPKPMNLTRIAAELNIGIDSLVFLDDNPAERELVRQSLPQVAVPEVKGGEPQSYVRALEEGMFFEPASLSKDDMARAELYRANRQRNELEKQFTSYEDFLRSLQMRAQIMPFDAVHIQRIAQLTNKSNQFNLTTRRCTAAELEQLAADPRYVTLFGRLEDRFGSNGVVSVLFGHEQDDLKTGEKGFYIDLWLMSCRVLKRDLELAMLDELVFRCLKRGVQALYGEYLPTAKNRMVKDLYEQQGFEKICEDEGGRTRWRLAIDQNYVPKNRVIAVNTADEESGK